MSFIRVKKDHAFKHVYLHKLICQGNFEDCLFILKPRILATMLLRHHDLSNRSTFSCFVVPYMQSAYTEMIPEEPLCSGKLHGIATEVLNGLKHYG